MNKRQWFALAIFFFIFWGMTFSSAIDHYGSYKCFGEDTTTWNNPEKYDKFREYDIINCGVNDSIYRHTMRITFALGVIFLLMGIIELQVGKKEVILNSRKKRVK